VVIEVPFAFFEEQREFIFGNAVKAAHMPLGLVPKILDAIDVGCFSFSEGLRMIDAVMMEL
jgi:hypothetical protein